MSSTLLRIGLCVTLAATAGATEPPDDTAASWSVADVRAERERLADLLASDAIERIDVVATTFSAAMDRIYTAVDRIFAGLETELNDPTRLREVTAEVIVALDDHQVRTSTLMTGEPVFMILDDDDAETLATVVTTATRLVLAHDGRSAPRATAERVFRLIVIDTEAPIPPLEQYRNRLHELVQMSPESRAELLR